VQHSQVRRMAALDQLYAWRDEALSSRKHANHALKLLEQLKIFLGNDEHKSFLIAGTCLSEVLRFFVSSGLWDPSQQGSKVSEWCSSLFTDFKDVILCATSAFDSQCAPEALRLCLPCALIEVERQTKLQGDAANIAFIRGNEFSQGFLFTALKIVLCSNQKISKTLLASLLTRWVGKYKDVGYYVLKNMGRMISKYTKEEHGSFFPHNTFHVLMRYNLEDKTAFEALSQLAESDHDSIELNDARKVMLDCWSSLFPLLSDALKEQFLIRIDSNVFVNCSNPLRFADLLTDLFDSKEMLMQILALNGLFVLMAQYNYEYPSFYNKLYQTLKPELLFHRHRFRMLGLLPLFLKSPLLPANMICSFVKKLARISLHAPCGSISFVLSLIFNLLRRNAACRVLIDRKDTQVFEHGDPFLESEEDPVETHAMESSLWEVRTLSNHFLPEVASKAKQILETQNWPGRDWELPADIEEISSRFSEDSMFDVQVNKKAKNKALASKSESEFKSFPFPSMWWYELEV